MKQYLNKYPYIFLAFALFALTCLIYLRTISYDFFIFDDAEHYDKARLYIQRSFFDLLTVEKTMMPVAYKLWGSIMYLSSTKHQAALRFLNISFHIINTFLLFNLLSYYLKNIATNLSIILLSCLFFTHPSHLESVIWISSLKGVFSSTMVLASCLFWNTYFTKKKNIYYLLSILCFLIALLSKITVIFVPFIFMLFTNIHSHEEKPSVIKKIFRLTPYLFFSLLLGGYQVWSYQPGIEHHLWWYITHTLYHYEVAAITTSIIAPLTILYLYKYRKNILTSNYFYLFSTIIMLVPWLATYRETILNKAQTFIFVLVYSFYKLAVPTIYSFDYGINHIYIKDHVTYLFSVAILSLSILGYYLLRKRGRHSYYVKIILSYVLLALPFCGLFYFDFSTISLYADRFGYLNVIVIIITVFFILSYLSKKTKYNVVSVFLSFVLLSYTFLSISRVPLWQNDSTLLKHSLKLYPTSKTLQLSLATSYVKQDFIKEALAVYDRLVSMYPDFQDGYISKVRLLIDIKRYKQAADYASVLIYTQNRNNKFSTELFYYAGKAFFLNKQYDKALPYLTKSHQLYPKNKDIKAMIYAIAKESNKKIL
jgi:hypothetical protein